MASRAHKRTSSSASARSASSVGSSHSAASGSSATTASATSTPTTSQPPTLRASADTPYDYLFKILVLGDSTVGKTALAVRFAHHSYTDSYVSTVGLDLTKRIVSIDNFSCKLHIWDTAGQDRFRTIVSAYYREAHGLLLVYDVTNRKSFENVQRWLADVERHTSECGQKISRVLVGNKIDLIASRKVSADEGHELAARLNMPFVETSAKADVGVDDSFNALARDILNRLLSEPQSPLAPSDAVSLSASSGSTSISRCCSGGGAAQGSAGIQ